ncbi:HlyC/CorC family transporter [Aggregatibacter actinomycetemcomitans]|uniref:Hemolysin n=1 Tax=Aggregatibacter actinomycetemcomitans serotype e str. SC1083 TaxID=907488 RepID=G4A5G1_AGGAC|nr:HlyC/CorC family transporter [Aggregatibacter actinomycetemcomitans]EGY35351.1 hemolysin [Aggregatibacter actinomycetemcomitans serotype e str. SC1083]KYK76172.1 membrane protein [Aggregatibacter actinomycetemcomitans serotype e str. SA3096]KYK79318.1 membrane protein [Aggregatibacter actinomycetemcomitans serotype e str. SC936]KYK94963.1 membrane protein [Aggregatibacter actinomycetemcomitans serotype e str. ANH9776]MBN6064315.1 HlyC/CorC family transporter [Aggregatibacter actinomycetemco
MDSIPLSTLFIILIVCLVLSAYFSGSETGLLSLNKYRLRFLSEQGNKGAQKAEKLLTKPDNLLSFILIFNNLVNVCASAIATVIGIRLYGDAGVAIATGLLTFVMLIFSEIFPKTVAAMHPEKVGLTTSHLLTPLIKIFSPLAWVMNLFTKTLMRLVGLKPALKKQVISREELRSIVSEAGEATPDEQHPQMLLSILDMDTVTVDDIMVPRNEIGSIDIDDDWKAIMRQLNHAAHNRVVLYKGSMDENVLGILRVREAFRLLLEKNEFTKETLIRAADEVYFIPEGTPLKAQLANFRQRKERIGLVVDEYGDIKGLVTLEDILEEIVGEFTTSNTPTIDEEVTQQSDGSIIIDGSANLRDLNKMFHWNLDTDEARTFNGLILEHLEEIPHEGTICELNGLQVTVLEVSENMIKRARVIKL